jgi:hypothetical protein
MPGIPIDAGSHRGTTAALAARRHIAACASSRQREDRRAWRPRHRMPAPASGTTGRIDPVGTLPATRLL